MLRTAPLLVAMILVVLVAHSTSRAQSKKDPPAERLKIGVAYTGEISGEKARVPGTNIVRYRAAIPIALKAGQEISATVTVTGKDRLVGLHLLDPMRKPLSKYDPAEKTVKLPSTEVSAKGVYTIVVYSDAVGPFTLTATSRNPEDDEEIALMEKVKRLRKELEETEAKLKALRDRK